MNVELLAAPPAEGFALVIGGDLVLEGPAAGRFDEPLATLFASATAVVNLEAPLVPRATPAPKAGPHLALPPDAARQLRALGVDVVGLANNHVGDQGPEGVHATIAACRDAGLHVTGAGDRLVEALQPATLDVAGTRVAILAGAENEFGIAGDERPGAAPIGSREFADAVAAARREHDVVIVLAHGGVEELPLSPPQRRRQLLGLIDEGADLVVGAHPHVVQGWEAHGSGVALHSVGDLLFDGAPGSAPGALVGVTLGHGAITRVALLGLERRGAVVALADPAQFAPLAGALGDQGLWQELAGRAFVERYLPLLARIGAPAPPAPSGVPVVRSARDALARMRLPDAPPRPPEPWEALHLLNHLRCESQRWTIETALELAAGTVPDLRDAGTSARADALLRVAGGDGGS